MPRGAKLVSRIYRMNTLILRHTAKVMSIGHDGDGSFLRLSHTLFHPQGGGQPSDRGTINGQDVLKVKNDRTGVEEICPTKFDSEVNHYVSDPAAFEVGQSVEMIVDFETRFHHAAWHTGGHLLAAVLQEEFGFKNQETAKHFPGECYVKFPNNGRIPEPDEIEARMAAYIAERRPIMVEDIDGKRHVSVDGLRKDMCGGTHLSRTDMLQNFKFVKKSAKKGKFTLTYTVEPNMAVILGAVDDTDLRGQRGEVDTLAFRSHIARTYPSSVDEDTGVFCL